MFKKLAEALSNECYVRGISKEIEAVILAQAQLESGKYIDSKLSTDAYNFWGMKCGSHWKGRVYTVETREVINGRDVIVTADFRMYDGITSGVWGYFDFLSMPIYENALKSNNVNDFMDRICRHWATDPSYRAKWEKLFLQLVLGTNETVSKNSKRYVVGNTYTIIASGLAVRVNAGTQYLLVGHNNLTEDGKNHDKNKNGYLDRNTRVTVREVLYFNDETWLCIPSGWICATMNGEVYVE